MTSNNTDSKLRDLIRKALQRTGISMRHASLAAGMNVGWIKAIMDSSTTDPGISAMVRLCNVLGIDKGELLEAVESDDGGARDNLEAAMEVVKLMTPAERAAFVLSRRRRKQP